MEKLFLSLLCILAVNAFAAPYWGEIQKFNLTEPGYLFMKLRDYNLGNYK
jgi:hypothetical protein